MNSLLVNNFPSPASLFSAYASITATFTLFQQAFYQFIPQPLRTYLYDTIKAYFNSPASTQSFTLVIQKCHDNGHGSNYMFMACETYLCNKLRDKFSRLKVITSFDQNLDFKLDDELTFQEEFEGVELSWKYFCPSNDDNKPDPNRKYFELTFLKDHKPTIIDTYLPQLLSTVEAIHNEKRILDLWTVRGNDWDRVNLEHPFTFDKLAMDPVEKKAIIDDLDRFVQRKEFYKRVGRAWKRGYLLYGPPGTGKSSLVAAMANYLRFDVYDLQLATVVDDAMLRELMLDIENKSILVIEDIDCSIGLPSRPMIGNDEDEDQDDKHSKKTRKISLSGLLNFIDGIWSSCGDERIIVFTTNHKDRLDPALLRPGRMDMHINMSYLNMSAFKILVSNYLLTEDHPLFGEIEELIQQVEVTPAQVAEELMRSEDVDIALQGVVKLLREKKINNDNTTTHEHNAVNNSNGTDHQEVNANGVEKISEKKDDDVKKKSKSFRTKFLCFS